MGPMPWRSYFREMGLPNVRNGRPFRTGARPLNSGVLLSEKSLLIGTFNSACVIAKILRELQIRD
jgi:hypothetical protein